MNAAKTTTTIITEQRSWAARNYIAVDELGRAEAPAKRE
jgi:hypothetical protein